MREEMGMCSSRWCSMPVWQKKKACFAMQDGIDDVVKKLVHRHPHVFGDTRSAGLER